MRGDSLHIFLVMFPRWLYINYFSCWCVPRQNYKFTFLSYCVFDLWCLPLGIIHFSCIRLTNQCLSFRWIHLVCEDIISYLSFYGPLYHLKSKSLLHIFKGNFIYKYSKWIFFNINSDWNNKHINWLVYKSW